MPSFQQGFYRLGMKKLLEVEGGTIASPVKHRCCRWCLLQKQEGREACIWGLSMVSGVGGVHAGCHTCIGLTHTCSCACACAYILWCTLAHRHERTHTCPWLRVCVRAHVQHSVKTRIYTSGQQRPPGMAQARHTPARGHVQVVLRGPGVWLRNRPLGRALHGSPTKRTPPPPATRLAWSLSPCFLLHPNPSRVFQ